MTCILFADGKKENIRTTDFSVDSYSKKSRLIVIEPLATRVLLNNPVFVIRDSIS